MNQHQADRFRTWLPSNNVEGRSIGRYVSGVNAVQRHLRIADLETLLAADGLATLLRRITEEITNRAIKTRSNYGSYVSKYHEFIGQEQGAATGHPAAGVPLHQ